MKNLTTMFFSAILLFVSIFVLGCTNDQNEKINEDKDLNEIATSKIKEISSDTKNKRDVRFFILFSKEENADLATKEIKEKIKLLKIKKNYISPQWDILIDVKMIPNTSEINHIENYLKDVAEKYEGKYDGWESEVIK